MKSTFEKNAGVALIIGSIMMVVTMILHPAGDLEDVILIISTHALAVLSIPITLLGFWGLTRYMGVNNILPIVAFITMTVGLFAAMCAAAISGFAYPLFFEFQQVTAETETAVNAVLHYSFALNQAMALIYVGASSLATLIWSIEIIMRKQFPTWLGIFGILLSASFVVLLLAGVNLTDLHGFRLFIFGTVGWVVVTGYLLSKVEVETKSES